MMDAGEPEKITQGRVIQLLTDKVHGLGWDYLGDWQARANNANIEDSYLRAHLEKAGYDAGLISQAIAELKRAARVGDGKLYEANRDFYDLIRNGSKISPGPGLAPVTVHFIEWEDIYTNHFGIAEEVAVKSKNARAYNKRPDIVLYVNGIALGVMELKRSTISVGEGIRQTLDNQKTEFIRPFFSTVQTVFAGNNSQGLRYAPILTPEPYWLAWKEESEVNAPLDRDIRQMLSRDRFLEIIHDFTVFDAGIRKAPRPNQYFAVKAAQDRVRKRESGIIWQTQGSGKSLIMVMLARWIKEYLSAARILIVTDRKELDNQIANEVFGGVGETVRRARSGDDLMTALADEKDRVVCSLVHKFGKRENDEMGRLIQQIRNASVSTPKGDFYVFIDECHRTQSGRLAGAMRQILPDAMFIGFTGTPLLRSDKATSLETFGPYIGTPYRFDEAVEDKVVLDLRYEARDIDQRVEEEGRIDEWFERQTAGLTAPARATLKARWGTLQKVLSSKDRLQRIVSDISFDMMRIPRLTSGRGNAILVAGSIPEACKLFEIFRRDDPTLAEKVAIVTSYKRQASGITGEETGMGETERQAVHTTYDRLLTDRKQTEEEYEEEALKLFREEPGRMKLLIVVSRLLTGFDAPPATYIYIDKKMQDHGLFQAICRVNRLDDGKDYGYIVDYKDLFRCIQGAVGDYTSEAFENYDKEDVEGLISDRAERATEDFTEAREAWFGIMEAVDQPKGLDEIYEYFSSTNPATDPLAEEKALRRQALYRIVGRFARTFAGIAEDPAACGYDTTRIDSHRKEVDEALNTKEAVELHSADTIDLKRYEPEMRRLIDTFIRADFARPLSSLEDMSLVDLIAERQVDPDNAMPWGLRGSRDNVAETIDNNVRRLIIDETPVNPRFYEKLSTLLSDLVDQRRQNAIEYSMYLDQIAELARLAKQGHDHTYPEKIETPGQRALYDNLDQDADRAARVDRIIRENALDGFRENAMKQRQLKRALAEEISDPHEIDRVIEIVTQHAEY
jgi:type I restriction enzyme R subunit